MFFTSISKNFANICSTMSKRKLLTTLLLLLSAFAHGESRIPIGLTYWDVGRCYDTIPSLFYDDSDYTPSGKYRWDTRRYQTKVKHIASVIDSMHMPLVALFGVETEDVVRDIVVNSQLDYSYLHRTIDGRDGLDFALLYFGDLFFIDYVQSFYGRIYIEGVIDTQRIGIWLTRFSYLQKSASPPHTHDVDMVIVAGGLYKNDLSKMGLVDHMEPHERLGRGNAMSYRGWYMRHRIGISDHVDIYKSGVYINSWLLHNDHSGPKPTISKNRYYGGYSSYLPIYLFFLLEREL